MKPNEAPKKIYLSYETDEDDKEHIFIDYMWHRHPFDGKNLKNVEYTRTDAFIEKACDAYCAICDTKECDGCAECSWVIKFRRQLIKLL